MIVNYMKVPQNVTGRILISVKANRFENLGKVWLYQCILKMVNFIQNLGGC